METVLLQWLVILNVYNFAKKMSLESGKNNFNLNIAHLFWDRLYPRIDTGESWKVKPSLPVTYSKIASNPWYLMYNLHRCFCYQHRNLFEFKIIWFYFNPLYSSFIADTLQKKKIRMSTGCFLISLNVKHSYLTKPKQSRQVKQTLLHSCEHSLKNTL